MQAAGEEDGMGKAGKREKKENGMRRKWGQREAKGKFG